MKKQEEKTFSNFCKDNKFKSIHDFTGPGVDEIRFIYSEKEKVNKTLLKVKKELNNINIEKMEEDLMLTKSDLHKKLETIGIIKLDVEKLKKKVDIYNKKYLD